MNTALLPDKRAVITGGGSGIGRAAAHRFAAEGAHVGLVDVDAGKAEAVRDEVRATGARADSFACDVADAEAVDGLMAGIGDTLGGMDVLVNAAGQPTAYRDGSPLEIWQRGVDHTLTSVMVVSRAAIPLLVASGSSAIVNISSTAAFGGSPHIAWYAASKAGILSLTKSLAVELGPKGVRVNAVCPGLTETPRVTHLWDNPEVRARFIADTPLGKLASPDDIAQAIMFLASDVTAGHITGVHLIVDGGATSTKL